MPPPSNPTTNQQAGRGRINPVGVLGAAIVLFSIAGAFLFNTVFAFWKYEGDIPTITGSHYILPFNALIVHATDMPRIIFEDVYILIFIYCPFLVAGFLGVIGGLGKQRGISTLAGFVGMCAVPASMLTVASLVGSYGLLAPGTEWTGLFAFNTVSTDGSYTMMLWVGFYMAAVGSYMVYLGRLPRQARAARGDTSK